MDSIPAVQRILGRIQAIESRIESLNLEFQTIPSLDGGVAVAQPSAFKQKLDAARTSLASSILRTQQANLTPTADNNESPLTGITGVLTASLGGNKNPELLGELLMTVKEARSNPSVLDTPQKLSPGISRNTTEQLTELTDILRNTRRENNQPDPLGEQAEKEPAKIIRYEGFSMQARTAERFRKLQEAIRIEFPNRGIHITSTMGGRHLSPAHPEGRAIDFVVDNLTIEESKKVEQLARDLGFHVFNEYIHDSTYKTGDHMHIEL